MRSKYVSCLAAWGLLSLCVGCDYLGVHISRELMLFYDECRSLYPERFVQHLPELDVGTVIQDQLQRASGAYLSFIKVTIRYPKEFADSIESYAKVHAVQQYSGNDSCLLLISEAFIPPDSTVTVVDEYPCSCSSLLPIPDFQLPEGFSLSSRFYKDATIYVLGAEKGEFLEEDVLCAKGVGLPQGWEHGYSRGMAISGKVVAYWLYVW